MIARTFANLTTRSTQFEPGNISTGAQAKASLATDKLMTRATHVAQDLLSLDGSAADLNPTIPGNVYLVDKRNASRFTGHAVESESEPGKIVRLQAEGVRETFDFSTTPDRQVLHHTSIEDWPVAPVTTETWVIFEPHKSKTSYKSIEYK